MLANRESIGIEGYPLSWLQDKWYNTSWNSRAFVGPWQKQSMRILEACPHQVPGRWNRWSNARCRCSSSINWNTSLLCSTRYNDFTLWRPVVRILIKMKKPTMRRECLPRRKKKTAPLWIKLSYETSGTKIKKNRALAITLSEQEDDPDWLCSFPFVLTCSIPLLLTHASTSLHLCHVMLASAARLRHCCVIVKYRHVLLRKKWTMVINLCGNWRGCGCWLQSIVWPLTVSVQETEKEFLTNTFIRPSITRFFIFSMHYTCTCVYI